MKVGEELRKKKMYSPNVGIWIKYQDFSKISRQITLDNVINSDEEIYNNAIKLFDKIWNPDEGKLVRSLCVSVNNLTDVYKVQLSIFNEENVKLEKWDELQETLDNIRKKYGDKSITYADKISK